MTVQNLFDERNINNRATSIRRTGAIPLGAGFYTESAFYAHQLDFNSLIATAIAAGRMTSDSRYNLDSEYQAPIQARFGVKFVF